jgi:hypothetical protein
MDAIGLLIARLHQMLGHDKAALVIGGDPGDKAACLLCRHERAPTPESRQAVIDAIGLE